MGKKCPLKTVALAVDEKEKAIKSSRGRAQSWWRPSRAWEARVECWWHGKWAWKRNEEQQQNEDQKWNKKQQQNDNQHPKNLLEVLPSNYHGWEFLSPKSAKCLIQNQNQIFLILPLIRYQLLPLFFLNLNLNLNLSLILIQCLWIRHLYFLYSIFTLL